MYFTNNSDSAPPGAVTSLALRHHENGAVLDRATARNGGAAIENGVIAPSQSDAGQRRHLPATRAGMALADGAGYPAPAEYVGAASFVSVPSSMLLRDAIYAMNEVFATTAVVVDRQGHLVGWLSQSLLLELFAEDSDEALRSPCHSLLANEQSIFTA